MTFDKEATTAGEFEREVSAPGVSGQVHDAHGPHVERQGPGKRGVPEWLRALKHLPSDWNQKTAMFKLGARAGLKKIRRLLEAGNVDAASALAKRPGVIKATAAGAQIRHLGRGGEGMATLIADPKRGLAVRKLYDPKSNIATKDIIRRKLDLAQKTKGNPHFAETYGLRHTRQGTPMTMHEYVRGQAGQGAGRAVRGARDAGRRAGYDVRDLRDANVIGGKVIDALPLRRGEFKGMVGQAMKVDSPALRQAAAGHTPKRHLLGLMGRKKPTAHSVPVSGKPTAVVPTAVGTQARTLPPLPATPVSRRRR